MSASASNPRRDVPQPSFRRLAASVLMPLTVALLAACSGGGGGGSSSTSAAPTVTMQASAASVANGGNVTLTWSSSNATSCTAAGAWFGSKATSGNQSVGPIVSNSTYQIDCAGPGGTARATTAVTVNFASGQLPLNRFVLANSLAPWAKGFGDIDGDGFRDVVVAGGYTLGGRVQWYRYPAAGGTWANFQISAENGGDSLQVVDVNGDGAPDVVASNGLVWFENPRGSGGDPTQAWTRHIIDITIVAHDLVARDINGDGRVDIVARPEFNGPIAVYLQLAPNTWTRVLIPSGTAPNGLGLALGDIDRDGKIDIVANGYWLRQPANPVVDPWVRYEIATAGNGGTWGNGASVQVADIDNDGLDDVVLAPSLAGTGFNIAWFKAPADPLTQAWTRTDVLAAEDVHAFRVVDMNGDGRRDIVFAEMHTATLHRIGILFNPAVPTVGSSWTLQVISTDGSHNIDVVDINGDGRPDILGSNSDTNSADGGALNVWLGAP
jgi:hypothetical protein